MLFQMHGTFKAVKVVNRISRSEYPYSDVAIVFLQITVDRLPISESNRYNLILQRTRPVFSFELVC